MCKTDEEEIVEEFFQLFKTPWEFYQSDRKYEIIFCTQNELQKFDAKLLIMFNSEFCDIDSKLNIVHKLHVKDGIIIEKNFEFPIYKSLTVLDSEGIPLLRLKNNLGSVADGFHGSDCKIIRVGYNIFQEVKYLLTRGQPPEFASIPTLDLHLSIIRNWIVASGLSLIEIPPVPAGYTYFVCLTHDVDFIKIKQHKFDRTFWGFLVRATIGSAQKFLKGQFCFKKLIKNWGAFLSLPLIYCNLIKDFWLKFDTYMEIEKDYKSTFFIIPFKNYAGKSILLKNSERRATKYDICDIRPEIKKLLRENFEIGLHGIDAWCSPESAQKECERITSETQNNQIGIRMHWLCSDESTPSILEKAGFLYDSTCGYNETIGYWAGTTQVFRPLGTKSIIELPLHIQDMALFASEKMSLSEQEAWNFCVKLIKHSHDYGGVITVLWHMRSIAPERLWDDFYLKLLDTFKEQNVCFATASQAVLWFQKRRNLIFADIFFEDENLRVKLLNIEKADDSPLILRIYIPDPNNTDFFQTNLSFTDIKIENETELRVPIPSSVKNLLYADTQVISTLS